MNELEQNYLEHHGILGQRWGRRNGPPYPLDAGDHSKSEKEAGYKKSLDGGRNEELYGRNTKKATKRLNKLDKEILYQQHEKEGYERLKKERETSLNKAIQKGKDDETIEKKRKAVDRVNKKIDMSSENIERGKQEVNDILSSFDEENFTIESKEIKRLSNKGEVAAMTLGGLYIGGLVGGVAANIASRDTKKGTKYNIREKTKEEKEEYVEKKQQKEDSEIIRNDKNAIAKQASKDMAKDIIRWASEKEDFEGIGDSAYDKFFKNKSEDQIAKEIEKKILNNINTYENPYRFKDGTINFSINGIPEYGDSQPLSVDYDPNSKKIIGMWWL